MLTATWSSLKSSPVMSEIRERLKKKAEKGKPTLPNKEANRTWREEILGNLSEEQKKENKRKRQQKHNGSTFKETEEA
jgi:hypothetical protein